MRRIQTFIFIIFPFLCIPQPAVRDHILNKGDILARNWNFVKKSCLLAIRTCCAKEKMLHRSVKHQRTSVAYWREQRRRSVPSLECWQHQTLYCCWVSPRGAKERQTYLSPVNHVPRFTHESTTPLKIPHPHVSSLPETPHINPSCGVLEDVRRRQTQQLGHHLSPSMDHRSHRRHNIPSIKKRVHQRHSTQTSSHRSQPITSQGF